MRCYSGPMSRRGSYPKGVARREEILAKALEVVARVGYSRTTVKDLAEAVGLTQNGLLYYFGSKENLFVEILRQRDRADLERYGNAGADPDIGQGHAGFIRHNAAVPGLVHLYQGLSAEATAPGHPAQAYFRDRFERLRAEGSEAVRALQAAGKLPGHLEADKVAALMLAVSDGLQAQWLYDPSVDMAEHIMYLWSLVRGPSGGSGVSEDLRQPTARA